MSQINADTLPTGGKAFQEMLSHVKVEEQLTALAKEIKETKSVAKRDALVKKVKYLSGLEKLGISPVEAYTLRSIPVAPPIVRPVVMMGGNRMEHADVSLLYRDHMLVNNSLKDIIGSFGNSLLTNERRDLYNGAKAVFGVGEAITGSSRGDGLKGYVKQISGETGPKGGFFHSRILSKKQDFSGRATIYAEPDLGFNEIAAPKELLWKMMEFHIIRDLVKNGRTYVEAKKSVENRDIPAQNSFNKVVKQVPIIVNRAPTLMKTNTTAHYAVPVEGKALGINPIHLPLYAGDFDGDAMSIHCPMTPEAVEEAKQKLLPEAHIYDARKGIGASMVAPGHEAIIGSMHITEPDVDQPTVTFATELDALQALKEGKIKENTPVIIKEHGIGHDGK